MAATKSIYCCELRTTVHELADVEKAKNRYTCVCLQIGDGRFVLHRYEASLLAAIDDLPKCISFNILYKITKSAGSTTCTWPQELAEVRTEYEKAREDWEDKQRELEIMIRGIRSHR